MDFLNDIKWSEVALGANALLTTVISYLVFKQSQKLEIEKLKASQEHEFAKDRHERRMRMIEQIAESLSSMLVTTMTAIEVLFPVDAQTTPRNNEFSLASLQELQKQLGRDITNLHVCRNRLRLFGMFAAADSIEPVYACLGKIAPLIGNQLAGSPRDPKLSEACSELGTACREVIAKLREDYAHM